MMIRPISSRGFSGFATGTSWKTRTCAFDSLSPAACRAASFLGIETNWIVGMGKTQLDSSWLAKQTKYMSYIYIHIYIYTYMLHIDIDTWSVKVTFFIPGCTDCHTTQHATKPQINANHRQRKVLTSTQLWHQRRPAISYHHRWHKT